MIKKMIKKFILYINSNLTILIKRYSERKKFKDPRRKKIYNSVYLDSDSKREIDDLYIKNYGKKIPYIWHKHFTAFTGNFDKYYFPELLYIPEFEYFMNLDRHYCNTLSDKNILPFIAYYANIKMPKTIVSCSANFYRDSNNNPISKEQVKNILHNVGVCFAKPSVDSCSGEGCRLINFKNGIDINSNENIDTVIKKLGINFVIQEKINCSDSIKKIYSKSVNTFRVITFRWKDEILFTPTIMRIGKNGNYLDNAHAGGIFIAIDNNGILHEKAFTEFKDEYKEHPDSKIVFKNYKIKNFSKVLNAAKKMHSLIPQIGVVNWDFTIDENETPILLEANLKSGSIWLSQMAHGKGAFGKITPDILKWIRLMKKTPVNERNKYKYGNYEEK